LRQAAALAASLGSLGYGWFWFFAGRAAPALGSTGAAKESLAWLAQSSAVLVAVGVLGTVVSIALAAAPRR
jgi:hypothetical protein